MGMYIMMYLNPDEFERYKNGGTAWGVSAEGRKHYSYMCMEVSVHASEVIGIEVKTIGRADGYNERTEFLSYDIKRNGDAGYGD